MTWPIAVILAVLFIAAAAWVVNNHHWGMM